MTPEAIERTKATRFQKGARVWNHKPIGYERVNRDGYIDVKVAEPKTFKLKHRIVWEENRGAIPRDHNIQFKDGNRQNCDIENLYLISRKDQMILNSGAVNLPDGQVATYLATASRKVDRSLRDELLQRPDLLEVKRQQLQLNRTLKNQQNERQNADS